MRDTLVEISKDVLAVNRVEAVPVLLELLCETTRMRFATVARVTDGNWTACAVHDTMAFGIEVGDQLDVDTTFCREVRQERTPIAMDQASIDPRYQAHQCPKLYGFESYVSVPIVLGNDYYFGSLCALDSKPLPVSGGPIVFMFTRCAALIAARLDAQSKADGAGRATSDFPDFRRGQLAGGMTVQRQTVERLDLRFVELVDAHLAAYPGRTLISHVTLARPVYCDPQRIAQLTSYLLRNAAARDTAQGPLSLIVHLEGSELVIEVWNDGEPIPNDRLDDLFAPYWPGADGAEYRGFGLPVCALIVAAHGGTITATSSKALGTQFIARIPLAAR